MDETAFKEVCFKRICGAVFWNIIFQILFLSIFVLFTELNIFHPLAWFMTWFTIFTSFSTWLCLLPLCVVIIAQGIVCSKEYISVPQFQLTRCGIIRSVFSLHNTIVGTLHVFIGYMIPWIYTCLAGKDYRTFIIPCAQGKGCFVEERFFLVLGGVWIAFYYFTHKHVFGSRFISFPIVQQHKLIQIKATFVNTVKSAMQYVFVPMLIYILLYYLKGGSLRGTICHVFSLGLEKEAMDSISIIFNIKVMFHLWIFSSVIVTSMKLMELMLKICLTQRYVFPVLRKEEASIPILEEGLKKNSMPIVQHLAFLDLFILSEKCVARRKEIFTISHPGGHPHVWNGIKKECLNVIENFTKSFENALKIPPKEYHLSQSVRVQPVLRINDLQRPASPRRKPALDESFGLFHGTFAVNSTTSPGTAFNRRPNPETPGRQVNKPTEQVIHRVQWAPEAIVPFISEWLNSKILAFKRLTVINYFIGDIHESRIENLILHSLPVTWATQSLSLLACFSLVEDNYGVMQNDLTNIIVTLLGLKHALDSHVKMAGILKKSPKQDVLVTKMRNSLRASVKRSLHRLGISFKSFIADIQLPKDVEKQMLSFIAFKES